jgi:hypothetical protein
VLIPARSPFWCVLITVVEPSCGDIPCSFKVQLIVINLLGLPPRPLSKLRVLKQLIIVIHARFAEFYCVRDDRLAGRSESGNLRHLTGETVYAVPRSLHQTRKVAHVKHVRTTSHRLRNCRSEDYYRK